MSQGLRSDRFVRPARGATAFGTEMISIAVLTVLAIVAPVANANTLGRSADPLVLTGADVPSLIGIAPGDVVAFRYDGGWQQIPIQVDERSFVDWGTIYNSTPLALGGVVYTDAGTFTGPDADPLLDVDDEIVVMIRDAGPVAPLFSEPLGVIADSGVEVAVSDPLDGGLGHVYLFRQDGSLDPAAGQSYINYQFVLLSGDYLTTYNLNNGPNPELSTIASAYYSHRFTDRWIDDELRILAGDASGVDILDRHKSQFAPGNCARSEDTFSAGEGAFVINKSGPVRAIRSYLGANSGPLTQREHLFYERRHDIRTFLRVHAIGGIVNYFDYSPDGVGLKYYNDLNPAGVPIDGDPDTVTSGALHWEMVEGAQGSLIVLHEMDTDIADLVVTSYYLDDSTPSVTQCTGDGSAYGSSGPWVASNIPCTDPAACAGGEVRRLVSRRALYYEPPGAVVEHAAALATTSTVPLLVASLPWVGSPGEVPAGSLRLAKSVAVPGSIDLNWSAACSTTAEEYAVYEGLLADFASHEWVNCAVPGTTFTLEPLSGNRYYLVVPVSATLGLEGSYGRTSDPSERLPATIACWAHAPHPCP